MKTVGSWWSVAGAWLVLTASVVGVYRLGRLHGQIAALESEVVHGKWK